MHWVVLNTQIVTVNFIPMQTFLDVYSHINPFRSPPHNFWHLLVQFHLTDSDAFKKVFSKVGGMQGPEQGFDIEELIEETTSL